MENFYFEKFTKVNESIHPESLKPDELQSLTNMRLDDDLAAATTRKGFSIYNSGPGVGVIKNIYDVEDEDQENYLLTQIGTTLRKSLNGTGAFSDIKTGLTNAKLRMVGYGDKFIFTNNNEAPFYSDLTTNNNLEVARPDSSGITLTYAAGSVHTDGIYRYLLVYITDEGQKSSPSVEWQTYHQSTDSSQFAIANLPVSSDARVTKKILYRTAQDTLTTFYRLTVLPNATTTFTDITPDADLGVAEDIEYLNTPDKAKFITQNNERIFLGNITKTLSNIVHPPERVTGATCTYAVITGTTHAAGIYKYAASYIDSLGNESELVEFIEYTLPVPADQINVSRSPLPNITLEEYRNEISTVRIYRTLVNGSTFYKQSDLTLASFQGQYPQSSLSIADLTADASLTEEYPIEDLHAASVSILPSTVVFSNLYTYMEFPEINLIQVYPDENDKITGILDDDNGILVFKERSICKIYTNGDPTNWQVEKLIENIGCDEPNSIYKYKSGYFFYFRKRPHIFDGREAKNIGESRKKTFDTVTSINGATFWHDGQFYILAVSIGSSYYLMAYDIKLNGWYKWTISQADDITTRLFGADKGKILIGGNVSIIDYDEAATKDTDSGSTLDINASLKTKDFRIDGFANMRLMMQYIDYRKMLSREIDSIVFMLVDPTKTELNIRSYNDNSSIVAINKFKIPTDAMSGSLKRARVINFSFSGTSMDQFINARLDYLPEPWGVERRSVGDAEGLGISHGSEAGVSD